MGAMTVAQQSALKRAAQLGRNWRAQVRAFWETGTGLYDLTSDDRAYLWQIRNLFGSKALYWKDRQPSTKSRSSYQ